MLITCSPSARVYPDYPPLVVQLGLEQAFDSCRWFLYGEYADAICVDWYIEDEVFYEDDKGNFNRKPLSKHITNMQRIVEYPIVPDTIVIVGDSAIFYNSFVVDSVTSCDNVKFEKYKQTQQDKNWFVHSVVAMSIKTDTILYRQDASGASLLEAEREGIRVGGWRTRGDSYNDAYSKSVRQKNLRKAIEANPIKINTWLAKQAQKKGWIP